MPNFCSSTVRFQPTMSIHHGSTSGCDHPPICCLGLLCDHGLNGGYRFRLGHRCTFGQPRGKVHGTNGRFGSGFRTLKIGKDWRFFSLVESYFLRVEPYWIIFESYFWMASWTQVLSWIIFFRWGISTRPSDPGFVWFCWMHAILIGHFLWRARTFTNWCGKIFFLLLHIKFNGIIILECPRLFHRHVGATCWCQVSWKPQVIYPLKGKVSSCICIFISFAHIEW